MTILKKLFGKYLLITNTVSCGLMMAAADTIQQRHEHWKKNNGHSLNRSCVMAASPDDEQQRLNNIAVENEHTYMHNYMRTRNMTAVGLLQGPFHHWFYTMLDKIFPAKNAPSVVKKMCLDQTIASPTCLGIFFVGLGVLERRKLGEINVPRNNLYMAYNCCMLNCKQSIPFSQG